MQPSIFLAYDEAHNLPVPTHAQETNLRRFSAGAISSIISVSFTYPLELLRVFPSNQPGRRSRATHFTPSHFSNSTAASQPALLALSRMRRPRAAPLADLGIGALSGAVAQTTSYSFEVVRRRMQVGGPTKHGQWLDGGETVCAMWARGGPKGFFVGLGIGYLKIIPDERGEFCGFAGHERTIRSLDEPRIMGFSSIFLVRTASLFYSSEVQDTISPLRG
ncbi:hypothetical protein H4582DRAFT_1320961 [Lactarius indigo]|nr:hypothetical protein H4582DRAFT_1320961 [Lactarius indigo]